MWTLDCSYLYEIVISFPLNKYPDMELLDHMVGLFLIIFFFVGGTSSYSPWYVSVYIPTRCSTDHLYLSSLRSPEWDLGAEN